ncbi:hypothetical protein HRbin15_01010 [bacterium HR15]|nr:hypothetical protein HRbin15_01010 [bacterium HR15]
MEIKTRARYMNRVLIPAEPLNLPEGAEVGISIWFSEPASAEATLVDKDGVLVVRSHIPIDVDQMLEALRSERWTVIRGYEEK